MILGREWRGPPTISMATGGPASPKRGSGRDEGPVHLCKTRPPAVLEPISRRRSDSNFERRRGDVGGRRCPLWLILHSRRRVVTARGRGQRSPRSLKDTGRPPNTIGAESAWERRRPRSRALHRRRGGRHQVVDPSRVREGARSATAGRPGAAARGLEHRPCLQLRSCARRSVL